MQTNLLTRRSLLAGAALAGGLVLVGPARSLAAPGAKKRTLSAADLELTTYRGPGCGCCVKWAAAARSAGFKVRVVDDPEIYAFKAKHRIPRSLYSCHTTVAGPYVIEGHVPFDAIRKLLRERPKVKGIGVAGMPVGSPGMEVPDGRKEEFEVYAFNAAGEVLFFT